MKRLIGLFFSLCLLALALTGCSSAVATQPASQPTAVPAATAVPTPAALVTPKAAATASTGGPAGVPAAPNASLIQGQVVSVTQASSGVVLRIKVTRSEAKPGFLDFGTKVLGQEIDALWMDKDKPALTANQMISGELNYQGDEKGGNYLINSVKGL